MIIAYPLRMASLAILRVCSISFPIDYVRPDACSEDHFQSGWGAGTIAPRCKVGWRSAASMKETQILMSHLVKRKNGTDFISVSWPNSLILWRLANMRWRLMVDLYDKAQNRVRVLEKQLENYHGATANLEWRVTEETGPLSIYRDCDTIWSRSRLTCRTRRTNGQRRHRMVPESRAGLFRIYLTQSSQAAVDQFRVDIPDAASQPEVPPFKLSNYLQMKNYLGKRW